MMPGASLVPPRSANVTVAAADPGFSQGGRQLPGGASTYDFAKFSWKLHKLERIWVPGGGGLAPPAPPLNPPLGQ